MQHTLQVHLPALLSAAMAPLVTLHLYRVSTRGVPLAVLRMALDRRHLRVAEGLRFAKLLGTGTGETFTPRDADPHGWGLLGVWDSLEAVEAFERSSRAAAAWRRLAEERWRVDLALLRSRGRWSRREPFAGLPVADPAWSGPVAAVTRGRIRWRRRRIFWKSVPPVSQALTGQPGLRLAVGIGEAPVGLQGTFSLWDSAESLTRYAYGSAAHRAVIRQTPVQQWYAEDLFARFAVLGSSGTVRGRDPLAPRDGG